MKKPVFLMIFVSLLILTQAMNAQVDDTVNIDFGASASVSPGGWNNLTAQRTGAIDNLINVKGINTGIKLAVSDAFNGINEAGLVADAALGIPAEASGDSFFGNSVDFSGAIEPTGGVTFSNLDPAATYSFSIFASRSASDNRETKYEVTGVSTAEATLNVASNTGNVAIVSDMLPAADGTITIIASKGSNNDNSYGFYYLGSVQIYFENNYVPPPKSMSLVSPNGGEAWEIGQTPSIKWNSTSVSSVDLEYSIDNGTSWLNIASNTSAANKAFDWTIAGDASDECLVRMLDTDDHAVGDTSDAVFSIIEDDGINYQLVVLGSSTAAGSGPTVKDSAWVWMYREYLMSESTNYKVTNLAVGGYTTYNLLPTGYDIPSGINMTIDPQHNITKALSFYPDAIIINLPSNDASNNYPVEDQLANYDTISKLAAEVMVPMWVCTPQPKNFGSGQDQIQLDMVDSTHAIFDDKAIDFWSGLFEDDGSYDIKDQYDSGDGTHMSNAGHKVLVQRVIGADIDTYLSSQATDFFVTNPLNVDLASTQGSERVIHVISDLEWTVAASADWLDLSVSEGVADGEVTITANSENSDSENRTTDVTFKPSGLADYVVSVSMDYLKTGIDMNGYSGRVYAYPNPLTDVLTINSPSDVSKIEIISMSGKVIMSTSKCSPKMSVDVSELVNGIYILRIHSKGDLQMIKLIK